MKQKIKQRIINYVQTNYKLLDTNNFINGKTYMNARCHINAVQEAYNNNCQILLTVCIGNDEVFVHFINQNLDKYIDNTLGWYGHEYYDYYLIRKVNKNEYIGISKLLRSTKKMLVNVNSTWLERKLKFIEEDDV